MLSVVSVLLNAKAERAYKYDKDAVGRWTTRHSTHQKKLHQYGIKRKKRGKSLISFLGLVCAALLSFGACLKNTLSKSERKTVLLLASFIPG